MEMSDYLLFLLVFMDFLEDWTNVGFIIFLIFLLLSCGLWWRKGYWLDYYIFIIWSDAVEGFVEEKGVTILNFDWTYSFNNSESDHGNFGGVDVDEVFEVILIFFNPVIDNSQLFQFSFCAAGPDVDGHLQILSIAIDPDEDNALFTQFITVLIVFVDKKL